jgi:hypothetical protein
MPFYLTPEQDDSTKSLNSKRKRSSLDATSMAFDLCSAIQ